MIGDGRGKVSVDGEEEREEGEVLMRALRCREIERKKIFSGQGEKG